MMFDPLGVGASRFRRLVPTSEISGALGTVLCIALLAVMLALTGSLREVVPKRHVVDGDLAALGVATDATDDGVGVQRSS